MSTFSAYTKKKKKEEEAKGKTFREYTKSVLGVDFDKEEEEDIAPVVGTSNLRSTSGTHYRKGGVLVSDAEAKERAEAKEKRTWFTSGAFENGYQFGDVAKTILGSASDLAEDALTGVIGMGESALDAMAFVAPYYARGQFYQNGGAYQNPMIQKAQEEAFKQSKKETGEFIKKDLYDEKAVAKKLLSNVTSAAYLSNINQNGGFATAQDWQIAQQMQKESLDYLDNDMEKASVFGDKSDALVQSAGQLVTTAGLQSMGLPWWLTIGVTSFGAEVENALNQGATMEEAGISAVITAGAEILTEKLSGGISFGGKTLDDALTKQFARSISNKFVRNGLKIGIDFVGEGTEEVVSSAFSNLGSALYKEKNIGELLTNEEAIDEYIESFIGGGILGGVSSTGRAIKDTASGKDSGLTNSEKAVVDKVYKDAIAEQETEGRKLTKREKTQIYNATLKALEKGYIDTDTIESVLGGDTYSNLKSITEQETASKAEYDSLYKMKNIEKSDAQIDRQAELKKYLEETATRKTQLKEELESTLSGFIRDSKLAESYNENARRKQKFEADLNSYTNENAKQTVKNFMEKVDANNTNKAHDYVDFLTRISEDRGHTFDFMTTAQLEESIENGNPYNITEDPNRIEAFVSKKDKTIIINMDTNKSLSSLVGHETSHTLENFGVYEDLQKVIFRLAKIKGEYEDRLSSIQRRYSKLSEEEQFKELTADLLGDYIFTDADFIRSLSTEKPNIFKRIYNEIKYLYNMATAGSTEARKLEKVKKEFRKIWRERTETTADAEIDDVKYSVSVTDKETLDFLNEQVSRGEYDAEKNPNGGYYTTYKSMSFWGYDENGNAILRSPMAEYVDGELSGAYLVPKDKNKINWYKATETIDENTGLPTGLLVKTRLEGRKSDSFLPASENQHLINEDWSNLYFNLRKKVFENGKWKNSDVPARYNPYEHSSNSMLNDQFTAAHKRDNLVTVKMYVPVSEDNGTYRAKWSKDPTGWTDWKSGIVATKIGKQKDLQRRLYLSRYAAPVEIVPDSEVAQAYKEYLSGTDVAIPDNVVPPNLLNELKKAGVKIEESGKVQYSLSDSNGKQLSKEQQDFFKDSKVRDENGNLKVMYHGTSSGGHTVFDPYGASKYGLFGSGSYFTDNKSVAESYTEKGKGNNKQVYETYLNIKNPIDMDAQGDYVAWKKALPDADFPQTGTNEEFFRAMEDYFRDEWFTKWEATEAAMEVIENMGYDGITHIGGGRFNKEDNTRHRVYIAFQPEQIKNTDNMNPTSNPDIRYSLSETDIAPSPSGSYNVFGKDIALERTPEKEVEPFTQDYAPLTEVESNVRDDEQIDRHYFLEDMAPESEELYSEDLTELHKEPADPFYEKDIWEVGRDRKQKAYMYENPEVKPFFQQEAIYMLGELDNSVKGEKFYNDQLYYDTNGEMGFFGTKRHTSEDIAYLLDTFNYTYKDIAKGLNAIIEDNGKENNAISKRIEFLLDERLRTGYTDFWFGDRIPPNQDYINLLNSKEISEYNDEAWNNWLRSLSEEDINQYFRSEDVIAPPKEYATIEPETIPEIAPTQEYEEIRPKPTKEPRMARVREEESEDIAPVANILTEEPQIEKTKSRFASQALELLADKGFVFENLAKKTKNRELEAKWNFIRYADGMAQDFIGNGESGVKALNTLRKEVENAGLTDKLYEYVYHLHNVDRMTLKERYKNVENKPVLGYQVTAEDSRKIASELETQHPELKQYAQDIYNINNYLRKLLVDGEVISQDTADLWNEMYPHYVPIRRVGHSGLNINVPLDTGRTGVNAPVKRAIGGNSDILPLFDTMAQRALQTYKAVSKNRFGVELKNTLGTTIDATATDVDGVIDSIDNHEELLQEGKHGNAPTFTVFENGERVTFEITEDMYNALKPTSKVLSHTIKPLNRLSSIHRGVLTEYNPAFLASNAIKDAQDVLINSQHPARTYARFPKAIRELVSKGDWYTEYVKHGGERNTYFEKDTNTFKKDKSLLRKVVGMPLDLISGANNFIERVPRLAEYIASRETGRSIEVSMLDSARVTTNFAAGGDLTKFLNRNGFTFLNASVQGAMQQVRNVREAKMNGLKGWVQLATKFAVAGLPTILLNSMLWDDDEEYEKLSDYVKENYYVVAKYGDGKFVRIPKGRTMAVIQTALNQTKEALTGDNETDLRTFLGDVISNLANLAPNNPIENNILAPIKQVADNRTWYKEDLVPTRLQDLPPSEQFDETTDELSKWLGEKLDVSPYKLNYLLDQYSGGLGDVLLPMSTPEAESGDNSFLGNMLAPIKDKFTTDSVLKNQSVSDFYDTSDTLTMNAKSSKATDEDVLKYKYFNSIQSELSELYAEKRELQNSGLNDTQKYNKVREIQKRIDLLAEEALNTYENVNIDGVHATIGDVQFRKSDDGWTKITEKQLEKQNEVTSGLGITPSDYWSNKQEYDYAYEYPEKYDFLKESGVSVAEYYEFDEDTKEAYTWAFNNPGKRKMSQVIAGDYVQYRKISSDLYDIKADKDSDGDSIAGSAKAKKLDYINSLDLDYGQKIILFRSLYDSKTDKATYNADIVHYLNSRDDVSYEEMVTILEELDFKVYPDGTVEW